MTHENEKYEYVDFKTFKKEYEQRLGKTHKNAHAQLKRGYCYQWCISYGKTVDDWIELGFDKHKYSESISKDEEKQFRMFMEAHA